MPLKIIGAGFGRTGTQSLKAALEYLGYQPCYSMTDVILDRPGLNDGHLEAWHAFVCRGRPMDWERLFAGYQACLDAPGHYVFRELVEAFPEAVVILTVRDPLRWFESWQALQETTARVCAGMGRDPRMRQWGEIMQALHVRAFGDAAGREAMIRVFERRIEEAKRAVPAGRLLILDVREGWAPLCAFLGHDVPEEPFPRVNDRAALKDAADAFLAGRPLAGAA
jgi:hypothetical protein